MPAPDAGPVPGQPRRRVAVVGGGVTGLAAAWELSGDPGLQVVVLEGADHVGGKLGTIELAGHRLDTGAEAVLARRPEAVDLIAEVAPQEVVQHPARVGARVLTTGGLRPLPPRTLMGVPAEPAALTDLLGDQAAARADDRGRAWPPAAGDDVAAGALVRARLGDPVLELLVEPLLGGVYAGDPDTLSLRASVPALWPAAEQGTPLVDAVGDLLGSGPGTRDVASASPVFAGLVGGVGRLPELVATALRRRDVEVRTGATVRALTRTPAGWRLVIGPTRAPEHLDVDAGLLAVPAAPASRLLHPHAPAAAAELGRVRYASMAVVTLVLPGPDVAQGLGGSGYLVPRVEGRRRGWLVKGVTASSVKWPWLAGQARGDTVLRGSIGRVGEERLLHRDDAALVEALRSELGEAVGVTIPQPRETHVQRWGGGLPQYDVGHVGLVARVRAAVAGLPGLQVAGAAYDGVGVPACIASGRHAARALMDEARGPASQRGGRH